MNKKEFLEPLLEAIPDELMYHNTHGDRVYVRDVVAALLQELEGLVELFVSGKISGWSEGTTYEARAALALARGKDIS